MFEVLSTSLNFKQVLKYFIYILACTILFLLLIKIFNVFNKEGSQITASAFEWEKEVSVYFGNEKMGSLDDCSLVFPVKRTIPNAETLGPGALEKLLAGPTALEKEEGFFTRINDNVLIQRFEVEDMIAYIELSSNFNNRSADPCFTETVSSQIEKTLVPLSDIEEVSIFDRTTF